MLKSGANITLSQFFRPKGKKIPARSLVLSMTHNAGAYVHIKRFMMLFLTLNKTLKIDSELDLSTAMNSFSAEVSVMMSPLSRLPGGYNARRVRNVKSAGGTGKEPIHASTMDVVTLDLPRSPEEMYDLEKLLV